MDDIKGTKDVAKLSGKVFQSGKKRAVKQKLQFNAAILLFDSEKKDPSLDSPMYKVVEGFKIHTKSAWKRMYNGSQTTMWDLFEELTKMDVLAMDRGKKYIATLLVGKPFLGQDKEKEGRTGCSTISIIEGSSSQPTGCDWAMYCTLSGYYWLILSVPIGYPEPESAYKLHEDNNNEFSEGINTLATTLQEQINTLDTKLDQAAPTARNCAIKCMAGRVVQFPISKWNHFIVVPGDSQNNHLKLLVVHEVYGEYSI